MKVVIIGNGVAGISAARHLRKLDPDTRILVISSESPYFFSRTALMYVYMGHMKFENIKPYEDWFWEKNRIELIHARVEEVDTVTKNLKLDTREEIGYDKLIIAAGSNSRFFDWPGQDLKGVQGLFSLQDLELMEATTPQPFQKDHPTREAVIVGGGLVGVELAEMLLSRDIKVTMLVRDDWFWGNVLTANEGKLIGEHISSHGVDLKTNTELKEILGDENGRVRAVRTSDGNEISCQWVGLATGVVPDVELFKNTDIEIEKGILVNENLETNIPDVYAAGDCAEMRDPRKNRKPIEPVWYVARMMGEALGKRLGGLPVSYKPGPWFNSAKFFDIEYQVYGHILARPEDEQKHFFMEIEPGRKFITIAYHPQTLVFEGINAFGVRLRHEYLDEWLRAETPVGEVVGMIKKINFDTEFYSKWGKKVQRQFQRDTGIEIRTGSFIQKAFK